jgi:hypothetical protein
MMRAKHRIAATVLGACLLLASGIALAQTSAAIAPGAAQSAAEAPGGMRLAELPREVVVAQAQPSAAGSNEARSGDPGASRGMAFGAGGGECRETVPGGTLLAVAYAVAIALMGGYVAFLAWKNAQLARAIEGLEDRIAKQAPKRGAEGGDASA